MKNSGYNHKLREQVINAGTIAHREDIGRCKRGEKEDVPIQERKVRPEEIEPRKPKVMEKGESWSTCTAVPMTFIKVPYTAGPGSHVRLPLEHSRAIKVRRDVDIPLKRPNRIRPY